MYGLSVFLGTRLSRDLSGLSEGLPSRVFHLVHGLEIRESFIWCVGREFENLSFGSLTGKQRDHPEVLDPLRGKILCSALV